ncbi:MAG: hypothetical protein ACOYJH_00355 [Anaerovoracaceae bacterium]|jgi:hypothetical protein
MLTKEEVKKMADLFFNGEPEKAYTMFHTANEWLQFEGSIRKPENQARAYEIMRNSDLTEWDKNCVFDGPAVRDNSYDVGY